MSETNLTELLLKLLFLAGVLYSGLLLLYFVDLVISAVGEVVERINAPYHEQAARRQLDKRFAKGKITVEEYRQMRQDIGKHKRG